MAAKPVVVGADGSEAALRAVEWAALEAERRKAPLRIVSIPAMPPRMRADKEDPVPGVADELRDFTEKALAAAAARAGELVPGLAVETSLLSGAPAPAIAESGEGALMVVVGARGISGLAALVLGSVGRYVAAHAPCPAVVVRGEAGAVHRQVVVGVRDPREATEAVAFAFEEAALRGGDLVAVHSARDADHKREAAALAETLRGWRDKYPAVTARPEITGGHAGQVLAEYSAHADLVVIGRHGEIGGVRHAIGSAPHTVLNHARGTVAIVPCAD